MLERALEQKRALVLYSTEHGALQSYMPSSNEWILIENLLATLQPFQENTLEVSKADATISVLKISIKSLDEHSKGVQTMRETMLCSIEKRFANFERSKPVAVACLDTRISLLVISLLEKLW